MNSLSVTIITLFIFCVQFLAAQEYLINAKKLTTNEGLANLSCTSVFHDENGFVWIGTNYGLNRYDGYSFKLYTKEKNDLRRNNSIGQIAKGEKNTLWLFHKINKQGTTQHETIFNIDIFDIKTEQTTDIKEYYNNIPFQVENINPIKIYDDKQRLWVATKNRQLFLLKNHRFYKILHIPNQKFSSVFIDKNDDIYISYKKNIIQYDSEGKVKQRIELEENIGQVTVDEKGKLWVETYSNNGDNQTISLYQINRGKNDLFHQFNRNTFNKKWNICKGFYYLGQKKWLVIQPNKSMVTNQNSLDYAVDSILYNEYFILNHKISYHKNILWFAIPSGLVKINIEQNNFNYIHTAYGLVDSRGITEDNKGNIYFNARELYKYIPTSKKREMLNDKIHSGVVHYHNNTLFSSNYSVENLGTSYDLRTKTIQNYIASDNSIKSMMTYNLMPTKKKNIFLAGTSKGLRYTNRKTAIVKPFDKYNNHDILKTSAIFAIQKHRDKIWLATNNGMFLMTEEEGILKQFDVASGDLPFNHINHFHIDKDNVFWLASKGYGLIKWQPYSKKTKPNYQNYTVDNGLSHNYLYAVYEDDLGYLWITSDNGLMSFHKKTKQVRTYTTYDGLNHNEFNSTSHYKARNGTFYFGGLGGIFSFHPKDLIIQKDNQTPLKITNISVLEEDKEIPTDKTTIINNQKAIEFQPKDKFIEFRFALLDFKNSDNHIYAYRIKGYRNVWTYNKENFLRLNNLPYGKYTLEIKGKAGSEDWSKDIISITIYVVKPFYLQTWFVALMVLSILTSIFFLSRYRIRQLEQDKIKLSKEVDKRTAKINHDKLIIEQQAEDLKALDVAKSKFFSNITHEFRTPLTLILGPINYMLKNKPPKRFENQLSFANNNAKQLLSLVNQLLDISKLEDNKIGVVLTRGDIIEFTHQLLQQLEPLRKEKRQIIRFKPQFQQWEIDFDQTKWNNIIINLVSNAMKFTPEKGQITIELKEQVQVNQTNIILTVNDSGIGILDKDLPHIFNRFYQVDNSSTRVQQGTGIGLSLVKELIELQQGTISVESQSGVGTTFTVVLPLQVKNTTIYNPKQDIKSQPITENIKTIDDIKSIFIDDEKLKILIIEDNHDMRIYIKSCLDATMFDIIEAENGEQGIKKAIEVVPDLIISDVMMPIKDGFEVVETLRQNRITSHIPMIMLTAKTAIESKLKGIRKGVDAYLTKPFNTDELILRIYKLIELRKKLQSYYGSQTTIQQPQEVVTYKEEDTFIEEFKHYVLQHLDSDKLDNTSLAAHFKMSKMQLHRKIKALTTHSTSVYIRLIKLEIALQLLKKKELSISEIAYQTGFSSPSHFSNTFKKHHQIIQ
ncbi:MAG: ATP-binding protein [Saprospiraceae bacterium]